MYDCLALFLMARRKQEWTKSKFERYVKEGRGKGSGKHYKPWITIQDFPSNGRVSRSPGWKSDRIHHFMSDLELRLFYLFEWSDEVRDIREQYPLLDLDLAFSIADEMGIKYPIDSNTQTPYILTTDFMLTMKQNGKLVQIARTVKLAKDLEKKRVWEKLELEKRYWNRHNIDWAIVTEQEISRIFANNIRWVHPAYTWELSEEMNNGNSYYLSNILKDRLKKKTTRTSHSGKSSSSPVSLKISSITTELDRDMDFKSGTSLSLFKHLVARKEIIVDMLKDKISSSSSVSIVKEVV